jgi:hypothetical protein
MFSFVVSGLLLILSSLQAKQMRESPLTHTQSTLGIYTLIRKEKILDVSAALDRLAPEFKRNFSLVHNSDSLQKSTFQNPRALLSSDDGTVFVSFNGDQKKDGYYDLEFLEYIRGKVHMRSLHFDPEQKADPIMYVSRDLHGGRKLKGVDCSGCHGNQDNLIPSWRPAVGSISNLPEYEDTYRGVYADAIVNSEHRNNKLAEQAAVAEDKLQSFFDSAENHDRYNQLTDLRKSYTPRNASQKVSPALHNMALSYRLQRLNADRLARVVFQRQDFDRIKYFLLQASLNCKRGANFEDFMKLPQIIDFYAESSDPGGGTDETRNAIRQNPFAAHFFNSEIFAAFLIYYDDELRKNFSIRWLNPKDQPAVFLKRAGLDENVEQTALDSFPAIPAVLGATANAILFNDSRKGISFLTTFNTIRNEDYKKGEDLCAKVSELIRDKKFF